MDEREEGRSEDGVDSNELNKQANKIKLLLLNSPSPLFSLGW